MQRSLVLFIDALTLEFGGNRPVPVRCRSMSTVQLAFRHGLLQCVSLREEYNGINQQVQ